MRGFRIELKVAYKLYAGRRVWLARKSRGTWTRDLCLPCAGPEDFAFRNQVLWADVESSALTLLGDLGSLGFQLASFGLR